MSQITTYGFCNNDCKQEIYTKEEVLEVLQQAIDNGTLTGIDTSTGFIDSIKDQQGSNALTFAICSSAEYAAIVAAGEVVQNRLYLIKDDATFEDLESEIETITTNLSNILNGTTAVPNATNATNSTNSTNAIVNSDGTYSGFTKDANGVLKSGDKVISQRQVLLNTPTEMFNSDITISGLGLQSGDCIELEVDFESKKSILTCLISPDSVTSASPTFYVEGRNNFFFIKLVNNSSTNVITFSFYRQVILLDYSNRTYIGGASFSESSCCITKITKIIR